MTKIHGSKRKALCRRQRFEHLDFEFVSDFDIRISDLVTSGIDDL